MLRTGTMDGASSRASSGFWYSKQKLAQWIGAQGTAALRLLPPETSHDLGMWMLERKLLDFLPAPYLEPLTAGHLHDVLGLGPRRGAAELLLQRQAQAGIQTISFDAATSKAYVDKAKEIGWANAIKASPQYGEQLKKVLAK